MSPQENDMPKSTAKDARGGAGRKQGRKPLAEGVASLVLPIRVTPEQKETFHSVGGADWFRGQLDAAKPSPAKVTQVRTEVSSWWSKRLRPYVLDFDAKSVVGRRCIELCAKADAITSLMSDVAAKEATAAAVDLQCIAWCLA